MTSPSEELRELRRQLEDTKKENAKLKQKNSALESEVKNLTKLTEVACQRSEAEEEAISLRLLKRLETLKKERDSLALEVEQEEEFLTNTLQRRLNQVVKEKEELVAKLAKDEKVISKIKDSREKIKRDMQRMKRERANSSWQLSGKKNS